MYATRAYRIRLRSMAETALITGASSGIGEQFARQLAGRGYDLILVARRKDRLEQLAERAARPRPTSSTATSPPTPPRSPGKVAELGVDVDLLVNNAGFGLRGRFLELDPEREAEMVRVNCEAVVTLTHAFLPAMVERGTRRRDHRRLDRRHAAAPLRGRLRRQQGVRDQLHGGALDGAPGHRRQVLVGQPRPGADRVAGGRRLRRAAPRSRRADHRRAVVRTRSSAYDRGKRSTIPGRFFRWFMRASTGAEGLSSSASPSACTAHAPEPLRGGPLGRGAQLHVRVVLERLGDRPLGLARPRPAGGRRLRQRPAPAPRP